MHLAMWLVPGVGLGSVLFCFVCLVVCFVFCFVCSYVWLFACVYHRFVCFALQGWFDGFVIMRYASIIIQLLNYIIVQLDICIFVI